MRSVGAFCLFIVILFASGMFGFAGQFARISLGPSALAADLSPGSPAPLRVLLASPRGDRDELLSIDVTFSEPMVPLGQRGTGARDVLVLTPKLAGHTVWLGTAAMSFVPDAPPPPGTRIDCRLPAGLTAASGNALAADFAWSIEYRRPRLVTSVPSAPARANRPGSEEERDNEPAFATHPPDDPILLAFDRAPAPGAEGRVTLVDETDRPVALRPADVNREMIRALEAVGPDSLDPANVLALRPAEALSPDASYRVRVPRDLPFRQGTLPLAGDVVLPFRTIGNPAVLAVEFNEGALQVRMRSETDPDTLAAYFVSVPPVKITSAGRAWRQEPGWLELDGDFPAGRTITVRIRAGMPDLFGKPLASSFETKVVVPHAEASLTLDPPPGEILPGSAEFLLASARNTGPVRIRTVWIRRGEMPELYKRWDLLDRRGGAMIGRVAGAGAAPWEARLAVLPSWSAPFDHPDSLCRRRMELDSFRPVPPDGSALLVQVEATALDLNEGGARGDTLREWTVLQPVTIGISSRMGRENGLLWVTDILEGKPVEGAEITLFAPPAGAGANGEKEDGGPGEAEPVRGRTAKTSPPARAAVPLWHGRTDADGLCFTPGRTQFPDRRVPTLALAEAGGRRTWLRLPSWYGDEPTASGLSAFVFTDRPIYRPGDTVRWKAYVRRRDSSGLHPAGAMTVEASIREAGRAVVRASLDARGNADGTITLPEDAPTGRFDLTLYLPGEKDRKTQLSETSIQVEAFRAPRFEVRLETDRERLLSGSDAEIRGRFAFFAGPPLANAPVRWAVYRQPAFWSARQWPDYSFRDEPGGSRWRENEWHGPQLARSGETATDTDGRIRLVLPMVLPPEEGDSRITVEAGARDLSDQSSFRRVGFDLLRGPLRPAVKADFAPDEREDRGTWHWLVCDTSGTLRAGTPVRLELVRRDWKTVRIRRIGGVFDYENSPRDTLLWSGEGTSREAPDSQEVAISAPGYYIFRATLRQGDGTELAAASGRYFSGRRTASFPREGAQWLPLEVQPRKAEPNDTVSVVVPVPPGGAEGLFVIEGDRIESAKRLSLSGTPRILFPLEHAEPPSRAVNATLVGPDRVPQARPGGPREALPYFAQGYSEVEVSTEPWRAAVEVKPDRAEVLPGDSLSFTVRLADRAGRPRPGEATVSVIDEAVLALTEERPRDPLQALFASRGAGIYSADTRFSLRLSPLAEKGMETSGGGGMEGGSERLRSFFKATAFWKATLPIGPDGTARAAFRVPDDLTRYRIRVWATGDPADSTGSAAAPGEVFGRGEAVFRVSKPLSIEIASPRFVRAGDAWVLGALAQNNTREKLPVRIECSVTGSRLTGPSVVKKTLAPGEMRRFDFPVRTDQAGAARLTLRIRAEKKKDVPGDAVLRTIPAEYPIDTEVEVTAGTAAPEAVERVRPPAASVRLSARVMPSLLSGLSESVLYLADYSHPCLEQLDSRLFGLLARLALADRLPPDTMGAQGRLRQCAEVIKAIDRHRRDGGFALWEEGPESSWPYLDGYTLWALTSARAQGVTVPADLYNGALAFVNRALAPPPASEQKIRRGRRRTADAELLDPGTRAFLSWVALESGGEVRATDLERLRARADSLDASGRICLALALAAEAAKNPRPEASAKRSSQERRALLDRISQELDRAAASAHIRTGRAIGFDHAADPRVRLTALAVLLYSRENPESPFLPLMVEWLLTQRRHGRWSNTHENAVALEALRDYAVRTEKLELPVAGSVRIDDAPPREFRFESAALEPEEIPFSLDELARPGRPAGADVPVTFAVAEGRRAHFQLRLERDLPSLTRPASEEGLIVFREFLSEQGRTVTELERGLPGFVHLALVAPHDSDFLVLEDFLPAGCEAQNPRLATTQRMARSVPGRTGRTWEFVSGGSEPEAGNSGARAATTVRPAQLDLRDRSVRFYLDHVPAGTWHVVYPVTSVGAGDFRTPGARASLLYDPEVEGSSEPVEVRIR